MQACCVVAPCVACGEHDYAHAHEHAHCAAGGRAGGWQGQVGGDCAVALIGRGCWHAADCVGFHVGVSNAGGLAGLLGIVGWCMAGMHGFEVLREGLHCRCAGKPARAQPAARAASLLDYAKPMLTRHACTGSTAEQQGSELQLSWAARSTRRANFGGK